MFIVVALGHEWEVAKPLTEGLPYDLLIRRPGCTWETVQVKSAYMERCGSGAPRLAVSVRRSIGIRGRTKRIPYREGDFDLLAAVSAETARIWLIPYACVSHLASNASLRGCDEFLLGDSEPDFSDIPGLRQRMLDAQKINPLAKLTHEQAEAIRVAHKNGERRDSISRRFNLAKSSVARIIRGESYVNAQRTPC